MRPLTLTVEGLRSFRSPVTIDFTGRDYLAIIGDTGAGKSSLLEAMGWALYGNTSWTGHPNQELMHDTSTATRVVLTFRVRGQTWRVTRTLRRRDDRTVGPASAELVRLATDAEGKVSERDGVDKVRPVNEKVQQLIGLNYEAFKRTVVLPQGQFALLLVADDPRSRAQILDQVWGVEGLADIKAAADETLRDVVPTASRVEQALTDAPEDPDAHLVALGEAAQRLASRATAAGDRSSKAATAATAQATAAAVLEVVAEAEPTLVVDDAWAVDAAALATLEHDLDLVASTLATNIAAARQELADVPTDDDGMTAAQVATTRATIARLPDMVAIATRCGEEVVTARADVEGVAGAANTARAQEQAAQDAAQAHDEYQPALAEGVEQARRGFHEAEGLLRTWRGAEAERATAATHLETAEGQLPGLRDSASGAETRAKEAHEAAGKALAAKEVADREHAAVAAAAGLAVGDDCTVCHRPLPEGWKAPEEPGHASLTDAAATAAENATAADRALAAAEGNLRSAETQVESLRSDLGRREAAVIEAARPAEEALGSTVDIDTQDGALLAPLEEAVAKARDALAAYEVQAATLREAVRVAAGLAASAGATHDGALATERRAMESWQRAADALATLIVGLPESLGVTVTATDPEHPATLTGLEAAGELLDGRDRTLAERAAQRTGLQDRLDGLEGDRSGVETRRRAELVGPLAALGGSLDGRCRALTRLQDRLAADPLELPSTSGMTGAAAPEVVRVIALATEQLRARALSRKAEAETARSAADATIAGLAEEVGHQAADLDGLLHALAQQAQAEQVEAGIAERELQRFAARVEPIRQLRAASAELEAQRLVLEDLSAALNPGAFPKWLTMRRSHDLLLHASVLLEEMTSNRYSFAEVTDPEAPWKVIDNDSGLPRSPASLSGGETFVASLSLALGMVEMMARSGGHLESLWLDEGFGALDRGNLDAAVEALGQVAARGRMVAVISHVRAVAEQVDHVLAVSGSSRGSQARWLEPNERAALAEMDAGADPEALAAVAGLLD